MDDLSKFENKINYIVQKFNSYKPQVKNESKLSLEIEARFRLNLDKNKIDNFVTYLEDYKLEKKHSIIDDYFYGQDRYSKREEDEGESWYINSKNSLGYHIFTPSLSHNHNRENNSEKGEKFTLPPPYNSGSIKIDIAEEKLQKIDKYSIPKKFFLSRKKDRTSYFYQNYSIDITNTQTISSKKDIKNSDTYEVEIEVLDIQNFDYREFIYFSQSIYYILSYELGDIFYLFNSLLMERGGPKKANKGRNTYRESIDYNLISKPRDLQLLDLTNNGIMSGYVISPKADGELFFLIYHPSGIWMISPKKSWKVSHNLFPLSERGKEKVIVGEYIESDNLFLIFDMLLDSEDNIKNLGYLQRLEKCKDIQFNIKYKVEYKEIISIDDDFFTSFDKAFNLKTNYGTDGLIFTPIHSPYITRGQIIGDTRRRILGLYPDVCKYKVPEKQTIDFLVKDKQLFVFDKGSEKLFTGSKKYPFSKSNYTLTSSYFKDNNLEGKIIEFSPINIKRGEEIILQPIRWRDDKVYPNSLSVALIGWNLLNNPIPLQTLKGEDITLLRKYHNQIKEKIISNIDGIVLDIGSGNGGDQSKYEKNKKVAKVLSVEPNEEFINEFNRRLQGIKDKDKFINPLKSGGQEYNKIGDYLRENLNILPTLDSESSSSLEGNLKERDLNIVFMLSLSFFWKDKETFDSLVKTIKTAWKIYSEWGGKGKLRIHYFSIIGDRVTKLFIEKGNEIQLGTIKLKKIDKNSYFVDILDSVTVFEQTEHYVQIDQLRDTLHLEEFYKETPLGNLPEDYILNRREKIYSSLFQYGELYMEKNILKEEILPNVIWNSQDKEKKENKEGDKQEEKLWDNYYRLDISSRLSQLHENIKDIKDIKVKKEKKDEENSLYVSILFLLSKKYREGDDKLVEAIAKQFTYSKNLSYISRKLGVNICLVDSYKEIQNFYSKGKWIYLYNPKEKYFQPLVEKVDNDYILTFKESLEKKIKIEK